MNSVKIANETQAQRVRVALKDTESHLAKEMAYSDDLRKHDMVSFYEGHILKLRGMLASWETA